VTKFFRDNLSIVCYPMKIWKKRIEFREKNFEEYLVRKYKPKYNSVLGRRHIHFKRV